jgi:hypothetical protein
MIDPIYRDECIEKLSATDPHERVLVLRFLLASPEMASSMLPDIEKLLEDRTVATLWLPMRFGEIRNLAAEVVATGRAHLKQSDIVVLEQAFRTFSYSTLSELADSVSTDRTTRNGQSLYQHLRDAGHLKKERLEFLPEWYRQ